MVRICDGFLLKGDIEVLLLSRILTIAHAVQTICITQYNYDYVPCNIHVAIAL